MGSRRVSNLRCMLPIGGMIFALAISLVITVAAAGSSPSTPLLIAVEGPQSGSQAANGLDPPRGAPLAVKQLNASGGLWNGRVVAIVAADDKGDASRAKGVARKVIARRIRFVIGPYNSSVGIENLPLSRASPSLASWLTT